MQLPLPFGEYPYTDLTEHSLRRELTTLTAHAPDNRDGASADWRGYWHNVRDEHETVTLAGIGREANEASLFNIEEVYTTLKGTATAGRGGTTPPSTHGLDDPPSVDARPDEGSAPLLVPAFMGAFGAEPQPLPTFLPKSGGHLLIEGLPGSGKTTFVKLVATALARDKLAGHGDFTQRYLGFADGAALPTPIVVQAHKLPLDDAGQPGWQCLLNHLSHTWAAHHLAASNWRHLLESESGQALLLVDGFDEVSDEAQRQRCIALVKSVINHWPRLGVVITSRPFQTGALRDLGFRTVTVAPLSREGIREFLALWERCLAKRGAPPRRGTEQVPLRQAVAASPRVRRLATNPVMLVSLCVVHWFDGTLPEAQALLYEAVIRWLLKQRPERRTAAGFTLSLAHQALRHLALAMMGERDGGEKRTSASIDWAARAVRPAFARALQTDEEETLNAAAKQWLELEMISSGVIEAAPRNEVRFWHQTFQEYLAAEQLAAMQDAWPVLKHRLSEPQWRETLSMVTPCLARGGEVNVDGLLQRVLDLSESTIPGGQAARFAIIERLRAPMDALDYEPPLALSRRLSALRQQVMPLLEDPAAQAGSTWRERLALANALGQGGDPRLVPARKYLPIDLPGIALARYPETVQEFAEFVDDGGYGQADWWSPEGWAVCTGERWRGPGAWYQQLERPNHPVMRVSWFEATAYCRWRTHQEGTSGPVIRLAEDREWSLAAQRGDATYPWGDTEPDEEWANFGAHVGTTTPVGLYLRNAGPLGHLDLSGNVWEWVDTEASEVQAAVIRAWWDKHVTTQADASRKEWWQTRRDDPVFYVRGGAWFDPASYLTASYRAPLPAWSRLIGLGFRLAAASLGPW